MDIGLENMYYPEPDGNEQGMVKKEEKETSKEGIYGQMSRVKSQEAKEERERLNMKERERREKEGVDWMLLSQSLPLIDKYLGKKATDDQDENMWDFLGEGDYVFYKTTEAGIDGLPEDIKAAIGSGLLNAITKEDGVCEVVFSKKAQEGCKNYKKLKENWNKKAEQGNE